jgi:hypothetical protein
LLLTLKQKDQATLQNPRASFVEKSSHNNGGKGPNARSRVFSGWKTETGGRREGL